MSKLDWIKLGYSNEEAEELSELAKNKDTVTTFEDINDAVKNLEFEFRAYRLYSGDIIWVNIDWIKNLGYNRELKLNEDINIEDLSAKIIERTIKKKYPNKKWWQFWLKQEEHVIGYYLMIL